MGLFGRKKYLVYLTSLEKAIDNLKALIYAPSNNELRYKSGFLELVYNRFALINDRLCAVSTALAYEKGSIDGFKKVQDEFNDLEKEIRTGSLLEIAKPETNTLDIYTSSEKQEILRQIYARLNAFIGFAISEINIIKTEARPYLKTVNNFNRRIFIVHGRNHSVRDTIKATLKSKKFEPIILEDQPNSGTQFLFDKFEKAAQTVSYAVIIMTGDDFGKLADATEDVKRARQNVILELGYFLSRLGKERVMLFYESGVEIPSDINGVVYNGTDTGSIQAQLLKELYNIGYEKLK